MGAWKCRWCEQSIPKDGQQGIDYVQFPKGWYYHPACYEERCNPNILRPHKGDTEEENRRLAVLDAIYRYIRLNLRGNCDYKKIDRQMKLMYKEHNGEGWTYEKIYRAFKFFYEVKHGKWEKSGGGIGIIPYVYEESEMYYQRLEWEQKKINESASQEVGRSKMIIVPRMEEERPKEVYNIEEW